MPNKLLPYTMPCHAMPCHAMSCHTIPYQIQLQPRYEGQLNSISEPIPYVVRPLVRHHADHHYFAADRQAETDSFNLTDSDAACAPILTQFEARGVHLPCAGTTSR